VNRLIPQLRSLLAQLDDISARRPEQRVRTAPVAAAMKHANKLRNQLSSLPSEAYENPEVILKLDDVLSDFVHQSGDGMALATLLVAINEEQEEIGDKEDSEKEKARKRKLFVEKRDKLAKELEPELGALGWLNKHRAPNFRRVRTDVLHRFLLTEFLRIHPGGETKVTFYEPTGKYRGEFARFIYELIDRDELGGKDGQSVLNRQWKPRSKNPK
jgi:hypothetical protein